MANSELAARKSEMAKLFLDGYLLPAIANETLKSEDDIFPLYEQFRAFNEGQGSDFELDLVWWFANQRDLKNRALSESFPFDPSLNTAVDVITAVYCLEKLADENKLYLRPNLKDALERGIDFDL